MTIYVAINSFNSEGTIAVTLESLINQDFTDWIAHIVDGGSTDSTLKLLQEYNIRDKRITFEVTSGRSTWLQSSLIHLNYFKHSYFMWLDPDDFLESNYLSLCNRKLNEECLGVVGRIETVDEFGEFASNHITNFVNFEFASSDNRLIRTVSNYILPDMFGSVNLIYAIWNIQGVHHIRTILNLPNLPRDFDRLLIMFLLSKGKILFVTNGRHFRRVQNSPKSMEKRFRNISNSQSVLIKFFYDDFSKLYYKSTILTYRKFFPIHLSLIFYLIYFARRTISLLSQSLISLPLKIMNQIKRNRFLC